MRCLQAVHLFASFAFAACVSTPSVMGQVGSSDLPRPVLQSDRIVAAASAQLTALRGHQPVWIRPSNLLATQADQAESLGLVIVLQRAPSAEQAFEEFLTAQQTLGSPRYHLALSPDEQGLLYGPTQHDIDALAQWLTSQGLTVGALSPSRTQLRVTGNTAAVAAAFRVHFSMYNTVHGPRRGPDTEPMVPAALAPIISAIAGLTPEDLYPMSPARKTVPIGTLAAQVSASSRQSARPLFTGSKGNHFITPADFAAIYDVTPTYAANNTGATIGSVVQHVAIVANSTANPSDIQAFFAGIGNAQPTYNVVLANATPPSASVAQNEAELDLERVLGTAPGVTVDLVEGSGNSSLFDSANYAVNTLKDPIVTMSFGFCEPSLGAAGAKMWSDLWMTAAGNMTSVFVSGGDSGAAACDAHGAAPPNTPTAPAINGVASTPYNTAVGGTEFVDAANPTQYWSTTYDPTSKLSALGYIPEGAWNDPLHTDPQTGNAVIGVNAGGGGASMYNPQPTWQTGVGVPADNARHTPDISFSGSYFHDDYYYCGPGECTVAQQSDPTTFVAYGDGGTSATAPTMAGIAALLNTAAGAPQGLLNPTIYRLANSSVAGQIFHDVTITSSGVSNCSISVPSLCNNSVPTSTSASTAGTQGFLVGTGYDQATGWGSLDVANFIRAAVPVATSLKLSATGSAVSTSQTITAMATLTAAASSLASPSGSVQFSVNGAASGSPVPLSGGTATSAAISFPSAGTYAITAVYAGDALYVASTSSPVSVVAASAPPALSLAANPTSISFTSGSTAGNSVPITITGTNNFSGNVTVSCTITASSAAFQPTCAVSPATASLQSNSGSSVYVSVLSTTAQAALHLTTPSWRSKEDAPRLAEVSPFAALALLGLFFLRRSRVGPRLALVLLLFCGAMSLTGCSGGGGSPTPPRSSAGTYTVTVSGTGTGTGALNVSTASTTFTVIIQ